MATDVERLVVSMETNFKKYERAMDKIQRDTNRNMRRIEQRYEKAESRIAQFGDTFRTTIAAVGVGLAVREAGRLADAYTEAGNKIAAAETIYKGQLATQAELADLAKETRAEYGATVDLYSRLARAGDKLNLSQQNILRTTELVNKAFIAGGASGSERRSGVLQLSQALASGELMGEELRSIRENAPLLAQAIADEFNTTIGGLKELGAAGELEAGRIVKAILGASQDIEGAFGATEKTIGDAFENLRTEAIRFVGELDDATDATENLSKFIGFAADNMQTFADAAVVAATAIGGALAGRAILAAVSSLTALSVSLGGATAGFTAYTAASLAAARATKVLSTGLAFFGGGIGVAIAAIAGSVGLLYVASQRAARAQEEHNAELRKADRLFEDVLSRDELPDLIEKTGDKAKYATEEMKKYAESLGDAAKAQAVFAQRESALQGKVAEQGAAGAAMRSAVEELEQSQRALTAARSRVYDGPQKSFLPDKDKLIAAVEEAERRVDEAQQRVEKGRATLAQLSNEYRTLVNKPFSDFEAETTTGTETPDTPTDTGPTEAEIARLREALELENALAVAEAQGDEQAIRAAERKLTIARLTADFEEAGYENARERAIAQADAVRAAELAAEGRRSEMDFAESLLEVEQQIREEKMAQLDYELELARLRGDEGEIKRLERQLEILREITALRERGLSYEAARAEAEGRAGERDVAEAEGDAARDLQSRREEFRSFFRDSFKDGLLAGLDENAGEALSNWWRTYTTRALEGVLNNLADSIFDNLFEGNSAGGIGGFLGGLFGGSRATGGHVRAGSIYKVNENTPNSEYFMPGMSGQIVPNLDQVVRAGGSTQIVQVDMSGSLVTRNAVESLQSGLQALGYEVQRVDQSVEPRATRAVKVKSARGPVGRW